MTFVIDASVAAACLLPDEDQTLADQALAAMALNPARAPSLFWAEMRNLLLTAERRGRLGALNANLMMRRLRRLSIVDEGTGADEPILSIAARNRLTAYDANYLALAVQLSLPLATNDKRLAAAAESEGISIFPLRTRDRT